MGINMWVCKLFGHKYGSTRILIENLFIEDIHHKVDFSGKPILYMKNEHPIIDLSNIETQYICERCGEKL